MGRLLRPDGEKMRALRVRKGWPREQLAQIADLNSRTIRRVEAGGNASFETLRAIAGAFGLEVHELMRGSPGDSGRTAVLSDWLFRLLSAETLASIVAWCMPYAPAAKGLMATFAMIVVAVSAIALSPLLIDREENLIIVDSSQSLTPVQPAVRGGATEASLESRTRVSTDARAGSAREVRPGRLSQPARIDPTPMGTPVSAEAAARHESPPVEHPNPQAALHAAQPAGAAQAIAGVIRTDWLRNLAQPISTPLVFLGQAHAKGPTAPPAGSSVVSSNRGAGGGYGILGRPFVRSGKSTAAFFTKVGSSIKRVF